MLTLENTCGLEEIDRSSDDDSVIYEENNCQDLQTVIKQYHKKIHSLEENVHENGIHIIDLRRDREKLAGEVQRLQISNTSLKRQLREERKEYAAQKERYCNELLECKRSVARLQYVSGNSSSCGMQDQHGRKKDEQALPGGSSITTSFHAALFSEVASLRTENEKLRALVEKIDEKNHDFCVKFLRMKRTKDMLWKKLQEVDEEFISVISSLMKKFDDMRQEYNFMVTKNFLKSLSPSNAKYAEIAQNNSNLIYENAYLLLEQKCLKKDINSKLYGPRRMEDKKPHRSINKSKEEISTDPSKILSTKAMVDTFEFEHTDNQSARSSSITTDTSLESSRRLHASNSFPK